MRYKQQILTKINALETKLDYVVRNLNTSTISAQETVNQLKQQLRQLQSVRELIEAE